MPPVASGIRSSDPVEYWKKRLGDLMRQPRWHGIADLDILLRAVSKEQVVVRKSLQPRSFSDRQASALQRIGMDVIVTILRNVAGNRRAGLMAELDAKAVVELAAGPTAMLRGECLRKDIGAWTVTFDLRMTRRKQIS